MTDTTEAQQTRWAAPKQDGDVLVWPEPQSLRRQASRTWHPLPVSGGEPAVWLGVPVAEVRQATRRFIGHADDSPLLVTGHQTELHHPGVWVKSVVIDALAGQVGGRAVHLAVDTDQPRHLAVAYPVRQGGSDGAVERRSVPLTDDPALSEARWSGRLSGPTPAHATWLERTVLSDHRPEVVGFEPVVDEFLRFLRLQSLEEGPLPPMLTSALHRLDWGLGLRYDALLASPLWRYEGFLLLVLRVLSDPPGLAQAYNRALARFRARHGITDPGRPMPDLSLDADGVELPFWLDHELDGRRRRPLARRRTGGWLLELWEGEPFVLDDGETDGWSAASRLATHLRQTGQRLAPRAIMLTVFARVLLADVFIHGIGGGHYDQVTDSLLADADGGFGLQPPPFAVATATLYHPWAAGRTRTCVACLRHRLHQRTHAALGAEKALYLRRLAELPRRSRERRAVFDEMRRATAAAAGSAAELRSLTAQLAAAEQAARVDELVFDRELFYGLQPRSRLLTLVQRVRELVGAS